MKTCKRCNKVYYKEERHFYKSKNTKDGLATICKECRKKETLYYASLKPLYIRNCKNCNKEFKTTNKTTLYCCKNCRDYFNKFKYETKEMFNLKRNIKRRAINKIERKQAKKFYKHYTEEENKLILKMDTKGYKIKDIALKLNRTPSAVLSKIQRLKKSNY